MFKAITKFLGLEKGESLSLVHRYKILILMCGPLYAIWMQCFEYLFIPFFNNNEITSDDVVVTPMLHNLLLSGAIIFPSITVAIIILAEFNKKAQQNLYIYYQVLIYAISFHYFLVVNAGSLHKVFIMGTFVLIFSVSYMMATARSGAAYMGFIVLCSIILMTNCHPATPKSFFVLGECTIGLFAFVTIADRRRLEMKDKKLISELRESKNRLVRNEELTRMSIDATGVSTWQWNAKTGVVTGSPQYFKHLGLPENMTTIDNSVIMEKFIHPEDAQILSDAFARVYSLKIGETIEYRMITTAREVRWFSSRGYVYLDESGEVTGVLGTTIDITEKKLVEFSERHTKENLELALEAGLMGTVDSNLKTMEIAWSETKKSMFGFDGDVPTVDYFQKVLHPDDRQRVIDSFRGALAEGRAEWIDQYRIIHPERGVRWIMDIGKIFSDKAGRPVRYVGISRDMTEAKLKEEMIHKSAAILNEAQKLAHLGSFEIDVPTDALTWSDECYKIHEVERGSISMNLKTMDTFVLEDDKASSRLAVKKCIENREPFEVTYRIQLPNKIKHVRARGRVILDEDKVTKVIGSVQDITKEVEMLEQTKRQSEALNEQRLMLLNASQMSALGEMAASIAHEIFTPVTAIKMRAQIIKRGIGKGKIPSDLEHLMGEVISDVDRCSNIITGLKMLTRNSADLPKTDYEPISIIEMTLSLCRSKMNSRGITLTVDDRFKSGPLYGVPTMISQVLLNLLNNSMDAVKDKKGLDSWINVAIFEKGGKCHISVSDSGQSIAPEHRDKIFKPFFTTKEIGKGTGLGLSISRSIVENHGGTLDLDPSSPNTVFTIILPLPQKATAVA